MSGKSKERTFSIECSNGTYQVRIGPGTASQLTSEPAAVVVADEFFRGRFQENRTIFLESAEERKNLQSVEQVICAMRDLGLQRDGHVFAVGGGVIQDVATLAASLYMRGVDWTYVPTTLMAMTDSCIGGKSSINAGQMKNLVGNIYPPKEVLIDTSFLDTLGSVGIAAGLAEAVKIAYCKGPETFDQFLDCTHEHSCINFLEMLEVVLNAKKWFIEKDEFDKAERRLLNFGHTFGHALEVGSRYSIPHGVAVAIGVQAAIEFVHVGRTLTSNEEKLLAYTDSIVALSGLTDVLRSTIDTTVTAKAFTSDKKHTSTSFRLILPAKFGGVEIVELPKTNGSIDNVLNALDSALRRHV